MSKNEIIKILKQQSERGLLDSRIVNLLLENYHNILSYVTEEQAKATELYKKHFELPINKINIAIQ